MKNFLNYIVLMIIDILALISVFYLTRYVRINLNDLEIPFFEDVKIYEFSFVIFITIALMFYEEIYSIRYDFWQELQKILKALFLSYIIVLALLTISKASLDYSRLFITLYFALSFLVLAFVKRYSKKLLYSFRFFKKRVLLVGNEEQIEVFKKEFKKNWYFGFDYAKENYNFVIIASKNMSSSEINRLITKYLNEKSKLYMVPYITDINFANSNIVEYSNIRYNGIHIENKLLIKRNIMIKIFFDMFTVLLFIPFFIILHVIISIFIKLDSHGKIFFKQKRLGKNDVNFVCYKYRTMYENSDELLTQYLLENPQEAVYYEKYHKYKHDPRITKVGKILRITSLDELPQIINVIKGEMSLVGPRPYMINEAEKLGENKNLVLRTYPGITGLWQVSGRNNLTFKQRNELEVWYIKNWSLWADFVILIKTIKVVLTKIGAQ